jgi:nitrate/nitrite-specific signal transduction histidine kinase
MPPIEPQAGLGRLHLHLPPETGAPAAARRALRTLPLGARADDILLIASELVTNAVLHADTAEPIELTVECGPDGAWVEVRDHGHGFEGAELGDGHGLQILAAASERWGIVQDGFTAVWFEIGDAHQTA